MEVHEWSTWLLICKPPSELTHVCLSGKWVATAMLCYLPFSLFFIHKHLLIKPCTRTLSYLQSLSSFFFFLILCSCAKSLFCLCIHAPCKISLASWYTYNNSSNTIFQVYNNFFRARAPLIFFFFYFATFPFFGYKHAMQQS